MRLHSSTSIRSNRSSTPGGQLSQTSSYSNANDKPSEMVIRNVIQRIQLTIFERGPQDLVTAIFRSRITASEPFGVSLDPDAGGRHVSPAARHDVKEDARVFDLPAKLAGRREKAPMFSPPMIAPFGEVSNSWGCSTQML
jgi:hypothetical protein